MCAAAGAHLLLRRWGALALIFFACTLAFANRSIAGQRTDTGWPAYVDRVRAATPDGAVVVGEWALATPLAYAAYVEKSFGGRIVETALPEDDAAAMRAWVHDRPVFVVGSPSLRLPHLRLEVVDNGIPAIMRVEDAGPSGRRPVGTRASG